MLTARSGTLYVITAAGMASTATPEAASTSTKLFDKAARTQKRTNAINWRKRRGVNIRRGDRFLGCQLAA
jgi:hypothetical protein